jgi:uncharacterized membrane protein
MPQMLMWASSGASALAAVRSVQELTGEPLPVTAPVAVALPPPSAAPVDLDPKPAATPPTAPRLAPEPLRELPSRNESRKDSPRYSQIIGGSVGAVIGVLVCALIVLMLIRRSRRRSNLSQARQCATNASLSKVCFLCCNDTLIVLSACFAARVAGCAVSGKQ